jgi:hypothetical protein
VTKRFEPMQAERQSAMLTGYVTLPSFDNEEKSIR